MALQMVHALEVSGAAGWYCDEADEGFFLRQYFQQAQSLAMSWMKWPLCSLCFFHAKIVDFLQAGQENSIKSNVTSYFYEQRKDHV